MVIGKFSNDQSNDADLIELLERALRQAIREDRKMTAYIIRMAILNESRAFLQYSPAEGQA